MEFPLKRVTLICAIVVAISILFTTSWNNIPGSPSAGMVLARPSIFDLTAFLTLCSIISAYLQSQSPKALTMPSVDPVIWTMAFAVEWSVC